MAKPQISVKRKRTSTSLRPNHESAQELEGDPRETYLRIISGTTGTPSQPLSSRESNSLTSFKPRIRFTIRPRTLEELEWWRANIKTQNTYPIHTSL